MQTVFDHLWRNAADKLYILLEIKKDGGGLSSFSLFAFSPPPIAVEVSGGQ